HSTRRRARGLSLLRQRLRGRGPDDLPPALARPRRPPARGPRMSVARLRLALVGETMFPLRDPFFRSRLSTRAAAIAARAEEKVGGNLTVSPFAPPPAHGRRRHP